MAYIVGTEADLEVIGDAADEAEGFPLKGVHGGPGIHVPMTDDPSSPGWTARRRGPVLVGAEYRLYTDNLTATLDKLNDRYSKLVTGGYTRAELAAALTALAPWSSYTSETLVARFLGDTQDRDAGRVAAFSTLAGLAEQPIAYVHGGDLVSTEQTTQEGWTQFLADLAGLADPTWTNATLPRFMATPGNHDVALAAMIELWNANLPRQTAISGNSQNFTFATGPVRWVILGSTEAVLAHRIEQRDWLADVLATTPEPWVIVCWHVRQWPADNLGDGADWSSKEWMISSVSRIEAAGNLKCRVVLNSHTHLYERIHSVRAASGTLTRDDANGHVYITSPATSAYGTFTANLTRTETIMGEEGLTVACDAAVFAANVPAQAAGFLAVRASTTSLTIEYRTLAAPEVVADSITFAKAA